MSDRGTLRSVGDRILVAPDSFKGTFRAIEVARAIAAGLEEAGWKADVCPLGDGGEGTAEALLTALGGERVEAEAHDPLGRPHSASFCVLADHDTAVVETAAASGLALIAEHECDPERASSAGTGELIVAAATHAGTILVGVGGSATTDGGAGAIAAIEAAGGLGEARLICLCDVATPWERAAEMFAPQKGADPAAVARLATRLEQLAETMARDPRGVPLTGAAGGLAGGLWDRMDAELVRGAPYVLDAVGFEQRAQAASAVLTGEGRLDATTREGKLVAEVALRAGRVGVPVHAIVGSDAMTGEQRAALGIRSVHEAETLPEIAGVATQLGHRL